VLSASEHVREDSMPDNETKDINYSYTDVEDPGVVEEQIITPSTLENIDYAFFEFFNNQLNVFSTTNEGFKKVPIFWVTPERSFSRKMRQLRDENGMVIYPLMTMERKAINKDRSKRTKYYASLDRVRNLSQGQVTIARRINQDETNKFATADAFKKNNKNDINQKRNNKKVVFESITIPYPIYVDMTYEVVIFSEYQQQMNEILTSVVDGTNPSNYFVISRNGHNYETFIEPDFSFDNVSALQENERLFKTTITAKVVGYTIGANKNENLPKIIKKQNFVEVRIGRERVIFDESNPNNDDGFFRD